MVQEPVLPQLAYLCSALNPARRMDDLVEVGVQRATCGALDDDDVALRPGLVSGCSGSRCGRREQGGQCGKPGPRQGARLTGTG